MSPHFLVGGSKMFIDHVIRCSCRYQTWPFISVNSGLMEILRKSKQVGAFTSIDDPTDC